MIELKNVTKRYDEHTVLGIMTRLLPSDGGEVLVDGRDIRTWNNRELVEFGRFPYSRGALSAEDERRIDEALEYMSIADIRQQDIRTLSGGQRQRAFLAMVLAQDTDFVLLDEPLNNLDMKHAVEIMKLLSTLVTDLGKTVVLVLRGLYGMEFTVQTFKGCPVCLYYR